MDHDTSRLMRRLLARETVAALGTLHQGEPAVSMTPFVMRDDGCFLIHVSALAAHSRDMRLHPRVALMVTDQPQAGIPAQGRPRISLRADATPLARGSPAAEAARALYLARFPEAAVTFELADFTLFALEPLSARLIAGFGRAHSLAGSALLDWLRERGANADSGPAPGGADR